MEKIRLDDFIENPKKALFTLSIPIIIGMTVQIMYNVADTAFVGRLGADSIAALAFSFPLFFILISINSGVSVGMGSLISRFLGAKDKESAENAAMHGLYLTIIISIIVSIVGNLTLKPLFRLFGASETVLPLAIGFMSIILLNIIFMFMTAIISSIFSAQGDTKTPMKMQVISLAVNIALDPIFIYVLGFGVKGAGIATSIAFWVSFVMGIYYIFRKSYLKIHWSSFKFSKYIIKEIFTVGGSATLTMLLISIYVIFINRFMAHFGTEEVASIAIAFRIESVATMPVMGLSIALVTLVGMFYGAKRFDLLKGIIYYGMNIGLLYTILMGAIFFIIPYPFFRIFTPDADLISLGSAYMRINVFTFPMMVVAMIVSRAMQGMGFGLPGLMINVFRIILVAIPLAYTFIYILGYGYLSIGVAAVTGGLVSNIIGLIWLRVKLKKVVLQPSITQEPIQPALERTEGE